MVTKRHPLTRLIPWAVLLGLFGCSSAPTAPMQGDAGTGTGSNTLCGEPAPPVYDVVPIGWASIDDLGQNGTTGGEGGEVVDVATTAEFVTANERVEPLIIQVNGTIGEGVPLVVGSHKTILGIGPTATIYGGLEIEEVQNVIVRNLHIVGANCMEAGVAIECQSGDDAVGIDDGAHHVWIDHCDVRDGSDGNLDVSGAADYVTISWTKFSYTTPEQRDHRYSNLIGGSDRSTTDRGKLRVTWHHCWWAENVVERMPRSRYGDVHVLNSYYSARRNSYCIRAGVETRILAEQNYFDRVTDPFDVESTTGVIEARDNQIIGDPVTVETGIAFTPPYAYPVDPAAEVPCAVAQGAGPH